MGNNKILYIIVIVLLVVIAGGGAYFFLIKPGAKTETPDQSATESAAPSPAANQPLSEQPNQAKFNEYFTEIFLAKLPVGAEFNPWKIIKTKVFSAGEQFCTSINMRKQVPANTLSSAVYDVTAKRNIQPRGGTFPQALGPGNSTGCEPLSQPVGKYEYKIYINDVLVAVLPFEVK